MTAAFHGKNCECGQHDEKYVVATDVGDALVGLDSCCDIALVNNGLEVKEDAVGVKTSGGRITASRGIGYGLYRLERSINIAGSDELYPMADMIEEHQGGPACPFDRLLSQLDILSI